MRLPCLFLIWLAATLDQSVCEKEEKENDRSFAARKRWFCFIKMQSQRYLKLQRVNEGKEVKEEEKQVKGRSEVDIRLYRRKRKREKTAARDPWLSRGLSLKRKGVGRSIKYFSASD